MLAPVRPVVSLFLASFSIAACGRAGSGPVSTAQTLASVPAATSTIVVTASPIGASPSPRNATSTASVSATPQASSIPVTPTSAAAVRAAVYQYVCFTPDKCVYESLAANSNGAYLRLFLYSSDEPGRAHFPDNLLSFAFAQFANQFAYWVGGAQGQLWLADLDNRHPRLIFADKSGQYGHFREGEGIALTWSPDDMHLIVEVSDHSAPDLIYHVQSGRLEAWPWNCDRVGVSPRSQRLAMWCSSDTDQSRFAIIEWGGEIWYSDQAPTTEVVRAVKIRPGFYRAWMRPWSWSPDGRQLAYFDQTDTGGFLHIVDAAGQHLKVLPGGIQSLGQSTFLYPEDLQWSQDGRHLLVNANGSVAHPCLSYPNGLYLTRCWQVLDSDTGAVLWTLGDSPNAIPDLTSWTPLHAALSPDGNLVAMTLTNRPFDTGFVVNIETGQVSGINSPVNAMRWGIQP